jgi:hypothetical protein
MLRSHRRFLALLMGLILVVPSAWLFGPQPDPTQLFEWRLPAPAPQLPQTLAQVIAWPRAVDPYLADHFGLRRQMIRAQSVIAHGWLRGSTEYAMVGRHGWFFLRADQMVHQSAGVLTRDASITETADAIGQMRDVLEARGTRFVFASPPNSATIYPDKLPRWARNDGRATEYDLMLAALAARGVEAVDLRPALRHARAEGDIYYQHNTHWTHRGALVGFNALAAAIGHPDWQLDPASVLTAPMAVEGGDLARMLGLALDVSEQSALTSLPAAEQELLTPEPYATYRAVSASAHGPTVMIIGDSFTEVLFDRMVLRHAGQFAWTHYRHCSFDWSWIERLHPDEVWLMPTERLMLCDPGKQPAGLPPSPLANSAGARSVRADGR